MLKKCKKLMSLGMMLLLLLRVVTLPAGKEKPIPGDPNDRNPPVSVCSPGWGEDDDTRN